MSAGKLAQTHRSCVCDQAYGDATGPRRPASWPSGVTALRLGDLDVDLARRKASRAGQRPDLTPKGFTLLVLLLRRRGEVLSRTVLAEQVWDIHFDSDTNVADVAVRRLDDVLIGDARLRIWYRTDA